MIGRVVSGGQTGVDRAALDVALELGIPCGGWCPQGRRAEDGPLDESYPLQETPTPRYAQRTEWNVRDSDATLVLFRGHLSGGSALTVQLAARLGKPSLAIDLGVPHPSSGIAPWLDRHQVRTLNIAGPRESGCPGIYRQAARLLGQLFQECA